MPEIYMTIDEGSQISENPIFFPKKTILKADRLAGGVGVKRGTPFLILGVRFSILEKNIKV